MNPDKTFENSYTLDDMLKAIDYDRLIAESEPAYESSNISTESDEKLDDSDFHIRYRMIRPPTKRMESA
jgi:hypothetical protein